MKNKYINFPNLIKLIIIFILYYFSRFLQYIPILLFSINPKDLSGNERILLSLFSSLCLLVLLLIIYRKDLKKDAQNLKKQFSKIFDSSLKYYLLGIFGMIASNLIITLLLKGNGATNEKIVQNMISASPYLMLINAGIIGPIIEELVFRKPYKDAFKTKWLFILTSGIIFGAMHVITSATTLVEYLYMIPYACLGLSFAYMDQKEDNIFPSIMMHILHNTILIILSILG